MRLKELQKKNLVAFKVMVVFPEYLKAEAWHEGLPNTVEGYEQIYNELTDMASLVKVAIERLKEANHEK